MYKFAIALILTFLFVGLISGGEFSAAQPTQQETHAPNSPVIYTGKGNVKVSITINEAKEICKTLQELIETYKNERDIEISELKKRIAKIHETELHVLPKEADEWAEYFLSTLPLRKDKVITQEKEETVRFEKERTNIPVLFEYSIKKFDEYILALKKHDKRINLKQEQIPQIITYADSPQEYNSVRIASFPNGTSLTIRLNTGVIRNNRFQQYPFITIFLRKNGQEQIMLWVEQIKYAARTNPLAYGDGELTDVFKKYLTRAYDIMIEEAYLRSPEARVRPLRTVP
ncbi:MAG: hypothetical protein ABSF48_10820 [Thermodesulfobacteriota bacterium]|jgi:hypothetical protein